MNVMKQKVFFLLLAVCFSLNLMAAKEEMFIFIDSQGNEYSCCILSQVEKTVSITTSGNTMNMEVVTIPQTIDISGVDYTVTAISPGFSLILKKIVLPPTIREIENNAFAWCKSLKTLPDISKWKTGNVIYMRYLFYQCNSLIFLPSRAV